MRDFLRDPAGTTVEHPPLVRRFAPLACWVSSVVLCAAVLPYASMARADDPAPDSQTPDSQLDESGESSTVDVEKSSCLVLSRFDAEHEIAGTHDTLGGHRLSFVVRRGRDGRVTARITAGTRAILQVGVGAGRSLVWRVGGIDVPASASDSSSRARLESLMQSSEGRALVELAEDLDTLVASSADSRARELSSVLLEAVLAHDATGAAFDVPPSSLAELRGAMRGAPPIP